MSAVIKLKPAELEIVLKILNKYLGRKDQNVWVFGSRAGGTPRPDSDLDLLMDPSVSLTIRAHLIEEFEESLLPFEVDLVNRDDLAVEYAHKVESEKILLNLQ